MPLGMLLLVVAIGAEVDAGSTLVARPEVQAHQQAGRRLSALSLMLRYVEENGQAPPAALLAELAQAQAAFLAGQGGEFEEYVVKAGDTLWRLGCRYGVSAEFLQRVSHVVEPRRLLAGRKLRVLRGPFRAVVSIGARRLRVYVGDALVREYRVAVGAPATPTPAGEYKVLEKVANPSYSNAGERQAPGSPSNPAGTRWLRLAGSLGIHGTNQPESIGQAVSDGCVRLANKDVEEVFDLLVTGSAVVIEP